MAQKNDSTGFWEEVGKAKLPVVIDAEEVKKANAEVARLSCLIEPIEEAKGRVARKHRNDINPVKKDHDKLAQQINAKDFSGEELVRRKAELAGYACKLVPLQKKARDDASEFVRQLKPLKVDWVKFTKEVNSGTREVEVDVVAVFEENERVLYRLDSGTRVEVPGSRTPFTADERKKLDQGALFPMVDAFDIGKPSSGSKPRAAPKGKASAEAEETNGTKPPKAAKKAAAAAAGTKKIKKTAERGKPGKGARA